MADYEDDDEDDLGALYDQSGNVRDQVPTPRVGVGDNSGQDPDEALDDLALDDLMKEARRDLFRDLLKAVRGGYATPAEKNVLRQMLKDNGMVMGDPDEGARPSEERRKADLPSFGKPEYE